MTNVLIIANDARMEGLRLRFQPQMGTLILMVGDFDLGLKEVFEKRPATVFIQDDIDGVSGMTVARHIKTLLRDQSPRMVLLTSRDAAGAAGSWFDDVMRLTGAEPELAQLFKRHLDATEGLVWLAPEPPPVAAPVGADPSEEFPVILDNSELVAGEPFPAEFPPVPEPPAEPSVAAPVAPATVPPPAAVPKTPAPPTAPIASTAPSAPVPPAAAAARSVAAVPSAPPASPAPPVPPAIPVAPTAAPAAPTVAAPVKKQAALDEARERLLSPGTLIPAPEEARPPAAEQAAPPRYRPAAPAVPPVAEPQWDDLVPRGEPVNGRSLHGSRLMIYGAGFVVAVAIALFFYFRATDGQPPAAGAKTAEAPPSPAKVVKLPAFIASGSADHEYGAAHPGWERYLSITGSMEYLVFRENGAIKALQLIALKEAVIDEAFLRTALRELFGSDTYRVTSSVERKGFLVESGTAAGGAELQLYRKSASTVPVALVITLP